MAIVTVSQERELMKRNNRISPIVMNSTLENFIISQEALMPQCQPLDAMKQLLNCIEVMGCKLIYADSKEWQKELLPKGCAGDEIEKSFSWYRQ